VRTSKPTIISAFMDKQWPLFLALLGSFAFAMILSVGIMTVSVLGFPSILKFSHQVLQSIGLSRNQAELHGSATELPFQDVDLSSKYFQALAFLKHNGTIQGYADGTIHPDELLTRAELLKIVVRAKKVFPLAMNNAHCFHDVGHEWFAPYVCYGKAQGWIGGNETKNFHPGDNVLQAESLKILVKAFDFHLDVSKKTDFDQIPDEEWYKQYYQIAQQHGILVTPEDILQQPKKPLTRGEAFLYLYRVLNQG
jgi:hypothetical protein